MTFEPIRKLSVKNYGCIREASFLLSPLHAFIGPNDSGKSTILRALRTAAQFAAGDFGSHPTESPEPFDPRFVGVTPGASITIEYQDELAYVVRNLDGMYDVRERIESRGEKLFEGSSRGWNMPGILQGRGTPVPDAVKQDVAVLRGRLTQATMVRFNPDVLREPSRLIPESEGIAFLDERGNGLAGVFDAIVNRDSESFARIQQEVCRLFPSVAKIGLMNISSEQKAIAVTLTDNTRIRADAMSEGLLYFLGFAALQYVSGSRIFLVEEPENGLHPARIAEVMVVLRELSQAAQVLIATHSPLVVNELRGNEVSVVTRDLKTGTRAVLLKDVPHFDDASKVYQPGEFWLSYSDGDTEDALLNGTPRA